jgi:hypothetical protein
MHTHFVVSALEQSIGALPADDSKSSIVPVLELLYETTTSCGAGISSGAARTFLQGVEGKGKGAKLAKLLLDLPLDRAMQHKKQVALQILESRVQRVERWQNRRVPAAVAGALV